MVCDALCLRNGVKVVIVKWAFLRIVSKGVAADMTTSLDSLSEKKKAIGGMG